MSAHLSSDRAAVSAFCERHHIARLALSGSVIRDDVREAGTRVSEFVKTEHLDIPWRVMVGPPNHPIHGYDDVDDDILWNIVTVEFPPLAMQLRTLLQTRGWA